jgi:nucleoside-diphosphate-sugar epimerase
VSSLDRQPSPQGEPSTGDNNAPRCYLVTGAAGFIASKVCEQLLEAGHTVVGVDNLNDYYDVRLKLFRLSRIARLAGGLEAEVNRYELMVRGDRFASLLTSNPEPVTLKSDRFEFLQLDIEDHSALDRLFARSNFSAVFNLAGRAGVRYSMEHPHVYLSTNTLGTLNLLECQRKYGVRKHVLASSSSLYAGCPLPFTEDQPVNTPQSPYAATKKAAELMAYTYHRLYGLDVSVLRYFTVFGPAGRPDMAPLRFIKWIDEGTPITLYGDGTQSRDFTYVDDIARGTILAAQPLGYEIINLGGGRRPLTLTGMIALIERLLGKTAVIQAQSSHRADVQETAADITKAKRLLAWQPEIEPEEGFRRAVEWHVANRSWLVQTSVGN